MMIGCEFNFKIDVNHRNWLLSNFVHFDILLSKSPLSNSAMNALKYTTNYLLFFNLLFSISSSRLASLSWIRTC